MSLTDATLATIATRTWMIQGKPLLGEEVVELYRAIPRSSAMAAAVGGVSLSDRRAGRALRILKNAGLVQYNTARRLWERKR